MDTEGVGKILMFYLVTVIATAAIIGGIIGYYLAK
jgi:hypothetical protein